MRTFKLMKLFCSLLLLVVLCLVHSIESSSEDSLRDIQLDGVVLIKDGIVVNHDSTVRADVLVANGKIVKVGENLVADGARIIDAAGKYVVPGGIDPHVHLELRFMGTISADDYYTGTRAALAGGTTMLMDFAIPNPNGSHLEQYKVLRQRADSKVVSDYGLHVGIVHWNDRVEKEMEQLVKEHGVNSFKVFMAYKGAFMLDDSSIYKVMKKAKELGAIVQVHAENGDLVVEGQERIFNLGITGPEGHMMSRPAYVEGEATKRVATLAWAAGNVPLYIVHVMSIDAMEEVKRAKERGQRIIGEPIIAGLVLDDSLTHNKDWDVASRYVMSPPLRPKHHQEPLLHALKSGVLDILGTDHCSFNTTQKRMGREDFRKIPNGIASVEHRLNLLWQFVRQGRLTPQEFVRATSTRAAQVFNIYPQKGSIREGSDADIAIIDPTVKRTITKENDHHNVDYSALEGWKLEGVVTTTISRGKVVYENGKLNIEKGSGKFINTPPFSPYLYDGLDSENANFHIPKPVKRN